MIVIVILFKAESRKCKNSVNKNLEWNERKCACECVEYQSCSNGLEWDANKCRLGYIRTRERTDSRLLLAVDHIETTNLNILSQR